MPVEDHEVHALTKHGKEFRYGCVNRKWKKHYFAPTRRYNLPRGDYQDEHVVIHDSSSRNCHYDNSANDGGCEGCHQRKEATQS